VQGWNTPFRKEESLFAMGVFGVSSHVALFLIVSCKAMQTHASGMQRHVSGMQCQAKSC